MMIQTEKPSSTQSQTHWAPAEWNLFAGASAVEDAVKRKADVRASIGPIELGIDSGRAVLDQYYAAQGNTNLGTVVKSTLSFENLTYTAGTALILGGFVASLGIDYTVFGMAAKDLAQGLAIAAPSAPPSQTVGFFDSISPEKAFAVGSLIFAAGLGIVERSGSMPKKLALYTTLFVASAGASFIVSNNEKFRDHFSAPIKSAFTTSSDPQQAIVDQLRLEINAIQTKINEKKDRLTTGGVGGKPMLSDGSKGNDDDAKDLKEEIKTLEVTQSGKNTELSKATPILDLEKRKDTAELAGRLLATAYIAAWLLASQLFISEIVRTSPERYQNFRDKVARRSREKKFIKDIENSDTEIREGMIRSLVESTLSRFSEKLSSSKEDPKYPDKLIKFGTLFEEPNYTQMVDAGVRVVKGAVTPRSPTIWEYIQPMTQKFNKRAQVASNENIPNTPLGQNREATVSPETPSTEERKPA